MKQYELIPRKIVVTRNAKVELTIESADVEHGLAVPALDIDEAVKKGQPAVVRFIATQDGTFVMRCSIECGRGHDEMKGQIIVR